MHVFGSGTTKVTKETDEHNYGGRYLFSKFETQKLASDVPSTSFDALDLVC